MIGYFIAFGAIGISIIGIWGLCFLADQPEPKQEHRPSIPEQTGEYKMLRFDRDISRVAEQIKFRGGNPDVFKKGEGRCR